MRTLISSDPFIPLNEGKNWFEQGLWPCAWVGCQDVEKPPFVTAYRRQFSLSESARLKIHVAADERYDLYLDGNWIGRGNERGAPDVWFYESYELPLSAGDHMIVARVWSLGERAAQAQMSIFPGFLLAAESPWTELLSTGVADWEAMPLGGYTFLSPKPAIWRGARVQVDGAALPWGYESGVGLAWKPVTRLKRGMGRLESWEFHQEHLLRPATLPPLLNRIFTSGQIRFVGEVNTRDTRQIPVDMKGHRADEAQVWTKVLYGEGAVEIPAHTARRVLIDLENYYCAYPEVTVSGGAGSTIHVHWAEALFNHPDGGKKGKGQRSEIEGKYFIGFGDTFLPDGGAQRRFDTLWWQAGRYIELFVQTGDQPLTIEQLVLRETRYPLEMESSFHAADARLEQVMPILIRGMQMCSNETFFDCHYYEELQYSGDSRLEMLTTYMMTRDDRLVRKGLRMFDSSRLASGLTQSRYPCRVKQIIAPFSLWWVMMVHDYAFWRNDIDYVRQLLPGVRATADGFQRFMGEDGLLYGPEGWNIMDWVPEWDQDAGVPPDGHTGASGLMNWQLVYALAMVADLEDRLGEKLYAALFTQRAFELAKCATQVFWDAQRGLLADDVSCQHFSEHTQCMALLAEAMLPGLLSPAQREQIAQGLLHDTDLARTTVYFNHYLFETYRILGRVDQMLDRMQLWFGLVEQGFKTPVEMPEPSRSDCHAWGSHPLYHYFATILGIRPMGLGFKQVEIAPQFGGLASAGGRLVHPSGEMIEVDFKRDGDCLRAAIRLPEGVTGQLCWNGTVMEVKTGEYLIGE